MQRSGHGGYEDVPEGDFLELVTKTPLVVAHFYHPDFDRCRIVDRHLGELAKKHFATRFVKLAAPVSLRGWHGGAVHSALSLSLMF